jgi:hypothetical protein
MHHELSKHEKKIARMLIDKGVDAEFRTALEESSEILSAWKNGDIDNRAGYHKVFKKIMEYDKRIANRYDGLTGSRYLLTIAGIYIDGQITTEDIKDFSEQTRAILNELLQFSKRR